MKSEEFATAHHFSLVSSHFYARLSHFSAEYLCSVPSNFFMFLHRKHMFLHQKLMYPVRKHNFSVQIATPHFVP